jgi:hypothetical protein
MFVGFALKLSAPRGSVTTSFLECLLVKSIFERFCIITITIIMFLFFSPWFSSKASVSSQVTFVAKNGDRYPPSPSPGILIRGPFKNDAKKPPSFDMELPPGFDVAGIIVYNPKDDQIPRRVLAWLADRLNIKIPFFNGNVLNFLTRKTNLQGLTNGDVSVNPGGPLLALLKASLHHFSRVLVSLCFHLGMQCRVERPASQSRGLVAIREDKPKGLTKGITSAFVS